MVVTRKKKAGSSNTTLEENEAVENALAETKNSDSVTVMKEPNVEAQVKDKVELTSEEANGEHEKINSEEEANKKLEGKHIEQEGGEVTKVNNDENAITTQLNADNTAADQNISEDDEIDGQEDVMWEDEEEDYEEDDEENVADEDEFSDEHATEEDNDDGDEISEDEAAEEEEEEEEGGEKEEGDEQNTEAAKGIVKGDGGNAEEHNTEKEEATPKNIEKSKERSKKKVQAENPKKVELGDKPESSLKRKAKERVESMGMIFICSSKTKNDCYQYRVLGLPEAKKDVVKKIYTGMRLFLYDVDLKLMYGIYKAAGPGGYNIEPKAFKSQFPSQVRFKVLDDCLPLPEEKFKNVIKENYYTNTKFDCILTSEQVKKLCKLFVSSNKRQKPKKLGRNPKAEKVNPVRRERTRRPRPADERPRPLREERVYRERSRKRPRKAITPRRPLTPPPQSRARSYANERTLERDPYLERRSPYRPGRDPVPKRDDPYLERRSPYRPVRDPVPKRHNPYFERRSPLSSRRDPYPERRYAYKDDPYVVERRDVHMEGRDDPYLDRRRDYRDGLDSYLERRDPYIERRGLYRDSPRSETYSYRRDPVSDRRDVYREDRGVEYRDSYRQPLSLETTRRVNDVGTLDAYFSYRERPSYTEPIYSEEYPSRVGLPRQYRL